MIPPIVVAISLGLPSPHAALPSDRWFAPDKLKHFFTAAFVQSVSYSGMRGVKASHGSSIAGASVVTAAFSIGKEISDRRKRGEFSVRDLAWDAAGAGAATLLLDRTVK